MQPSNIIQLIRSLEDPEFIEPTYIASNHALVATIILAATPSQIFSAYPSMSAPLLSARYFEIKETMVQEVRLIYFVLFRIFQSTVIIPELISYLLHNLSAPSREKAVFFSPWHPFFYAVETLSLLTQNRFPPLTIECFEEQEVIYLESIRDWYTN